MADVYESGSDQLDGDRLAAALADTRWTRVEAVDSTSSTNADLIGRAEESGLDGTVRLTTDQTAGRGRHARVWAAPAGGQLATSVVIAVGDNTAQLGWLSLLTGLATAEAIEEVIGVRPVLKWPNDVLLDDRKVAGILAEYARTPDGGIAVIGTGINTALTEEQLPVETATSLQLAVGHPVSAEDVAIAYLRALSSWLAWWPDRVDELVEAYRRRSDTIGRRVRLVLPGDRTVEGTATGVDAQGRILVDADGERIVAAAGDVTHLRAID
ncbi:biotin--[acetyl-CoA-carboxylase] ligase [Gordonia soli]|uniref:biotin--[biotin carboxyl-carrier protein] ligase n=1 Tax=Gordonia soli NBRC 108243 TaxID=1223545 RepID=M0QMX2_9ACTN|nr:biotin--[acetyl-CoA-carboxylase] ligase [Gordonia soli]GAC69764.1 putative biotin--[acetyl-CoA-carboxylase] synthetase [Gordonia soli NBRC 108243]